MLNLAGFTYGMKGFLVAAPASLIASAVVFVVMRYLSRGGFRSWSEKNEKWQALEAVIVRVLLHIYLGQLVIETHRMPKDFPSSFLSGCPLSHHGRTQISYFLYVNCCLH